MISIISNEEDFFDVYRSHPLPVVLYGAGKNLRKFLGKVPRVDMICDGKRAGEIIYNKEIQSPQSIEALGDKVYVIITVFDKDIYDQIVNELKDSKGILQVVYGCRNVGFLYDYWSTEKLYHVSNRDRLIKINLVCAEDSWIFRKFADRMAECLEAEKVDVSISNDTRGDVDINHHIPYIAYHPFSNDTLMITHVDNMTKVNMLKKQLNIAQIGVCMSRDTMDTLVSYGIERSKLCYINPAHDMKIQPHKYRIGITHKCHDSEDLRKRATALLDVLEGIDSRYFRLFIMGEGWDRIVESLNKQGFEVEYYDNFDYDTYTQKMQEIDYFLYMGFDEGTMGFLDAMAAGAGTIVTPQGYHLDTNCPIDYSCKNVSDFHNALLDLQEKRKKRIDAVKNWTWNNYTKKHLTIWKYILKADSLSNLYQDQHLYNDGIFSMMIEDNRI